jgi:hypothetical protein
VCFVLAFFFLIPGDSRREGDTAFHVDGQWLSAANGTLKMTGSTKYTGTDVFGAFAAVTVSWAGGKQNTFETVVKTYTDFVVYEQIWLSGSNNTATGSPDDVLSSFPSFSTAASANLGVVGW